MHIINFYNSFLESLGYVRDGDLLCYEEDKEPLFFTYNKVKRRMVMPTSAMIRLGMEHHGNECHAFHPLCESVLSGESGTIRFIKKAIRTAVWCDSIGLADAILDVLCSGTTLRQAAIKKFVTNEVCEGVKEPKFDEKLYKAWGSIKEYLLNVEPRLQTGLVIGSNIKIDDVKYIRVANFRQLFEEESNDDTTMLFENKLPRKQDKAIIFNLMRSILSWYPTTTGSNDSRPYFGSLARGWAQYVFNYNRIVKGLRDHCPLKPLSEEWIGELDGMSEFDNVIQTLPYNTGPVDNKEDTSARDYSLTSRPADNSPSRLASDLAASSAPVPEENSVAAFFQKRAPVKQNGFDTSRLSIAQQRLITGNYQTNASNNVSGRSLHEALGVPAPVANNGLTLGGGSGLSLGNDNSLFSSTQSSGSIFAPQNNGSIFASTNNPLSAPTTTGLSLNTNSGLSLGGGLTLPGGLTL